MSHLPYPTPHIDATPEQIAKTVLMPGDPMRAKFVAESFLENAVPFNNVRGVQGYTGTYHGRPVSVMGGGMGMPSTAIYSYELFHFFDVEQIIRIGTVGSLQKNVQVGDLVIGMGACTDSSFGSQFGLGGAFAPIADFDLLTHAVALAKEKGLRHHVGNLLSSDIFYGDGPNPTQTWGKMGVLAVEMEAAALYMNAARAGKRALAVCTVSDSLITGEGMDAATRERGLTDMIGLALELAI